MKKNYTPYRFLFAAGGTGGHLFPAIAVAEAIRKAKPESEFLFLGTADKLESKIIPSEGFNFKPLWISGFSRQLTLKNIMFPLKLFVSMMQSLVINMKFKPRVAVGAGAYVAGPALWGASIMGSKIILLEQNTYPGITNRLLEKKATEVHLSFEESKKYFRMQEKLFVSGNPVRTDLSLIDKSEAKRMLGLEPDKKTLFILGGSLGAKSLNAAAAENLDRLKDEGIQVIWQCGSIYYEEYKKYENPGVKIYAFIDEMSKVYSASDLLLARAGATTIAEVSELGLPVIFVPSPNVSADHQYKNAETLYNSGACGLIKDSEIKEKLTTEVANIIRDENKLKGLSENIKKFSIPGAAEKIAERAIKLAEVL